MIIAEHLINLKRPEKGIYIDAGCFHPFRFSNTRLLNLLGWRGINIDASKKAIAEFKHYRPDDYNICAALAEKQEDNEFIHAGGGAGSRLVKGSIPLPGAASINYRTSVVTQTLREIFNNSPHVDSPVDFLDIDCEGIDFSILKGFDIIKTRPGLICIEAHTSDEKNQITKYLENQDYHFICTCGPSLLFRDQRIFYPKEE
ncbi:MAG: FkbM family methyltransferase [Chthoniobacterales bacterium]